MVLVRMALPVEFSIARLSDGSCALQPFEGFCFPILGIQDKDCDQEDKAGGRAGTQVLWGAAEALGLSCWEKRRLKGNPQRENGAELCQGRHRLDIRKHFCTKRLGRHWNRLPGGLLIPQASQSAKGICAMPFKTFSSLELARQWHRTIQLKLSVPFWSLGMPSAGLFL